MLVDRRNGDPINAACVRTKVLLSIDGSDVDLGHFKPEAWLTQAFNLVGGRLQVDHAAIEANLPGVTNRKASKNPDATQKIFMVEFECPATTGGGNGKGRTKQARRFQNRVALRYVPPLSPLNPTNFYQVLFQHLLSLHGPVIQRQGGDQVLGQAIDANDASSLSYPSTDVDLSDDPPLYGDGSIIHEPICPYSYVLGPLLFCQSMAVLQDSALNNRTGDGGVVVTCQGDYPSYKQGLIDQSKTLGTDKAGNPLPGPFVDLLADGQLPDQVPWDTIEQEKATLFWLFDKTQNLGPWAACDDKSGRIKYPFKDEFAPGFGPTNLYYINNDNEQPGSNFTYTPIAQSAISKDGKTFVLAFRGTNSRSEWIYDFAYSQFDVTDTLLQDPTYANLYPFKNTKIHRGFAIVFLQIYYNIYQDVKAAESQLTRIIVTGHSLGGGMAQLLAYALAHDFDIPVDAAMFAPPTAGNAVFAQNFNQMVNGRRLEYVAYAPQGWHLATSLELKDIYPLGDAVPQIMCPTQYVCDFPIANFEQYFDAKQVVPVRTRGSFDFDLAISYTAVGGNVLFDYRHLPDPPTEYGLPDNIIRNTWKVLDGLTYELNAHICSYGCFLSSAVNAPLNKCFIKENDKNSDQNIVGELDGVFYDDWTVGIINENVDPYVVKYGLC